MRIDARGSQGNTFYIISVVKKLLEDVGRHDEWADVYEDMTSGDYQHLCDVAYRATNGSIEVINREGL